MAVDSWYQGFLREGPLTPIPLLQYSESTPIGLIDPRTGLPIAPVAEFTWAQFITKTPADFGAIYVRVTDKHSSISGAGGSTWFSDVVNNKFALVSGPIVTTWAARPAANLAYIGLGLEIRLSDYTTYPNYFSNGTDYLPNGRQLLSHGVFGTLAAPTVFQAVDTAAHELTIVGGKPKILGGIGIAGSRFLVQGHWYRNNATANAPSAAISLGTAAAYGTDPNIWGSGITNTAALSVYCDTYLNLVSQTAVISSYNGIRGGAGGASTGIDRTMAFASDQTFSVGLGAVASANTDKISLQSLTIWHEA